MGSGRRLQGLGVALLALAGATLGVAANAAASPLSPEQVRALDPGEDYVPGEVMVRFDDGTGAADRAAIRDDAGASLAQRLLMPRLQLIELPPGDSVAVAIAALN